MNNFRIFKEIDRYGYEINNSILLLNDKDNILNNWFNSVSEAIQYVENNNSNLSVEL